MAKEIIDSVEKLEEELARVREAQRKFSTYTQEQVDKIFLAAAKAAKIQRPAVLLMRIRLTAQSVLQSLSALFAQLFLQLTLHQLLFLKPLFLLKRETVSLFRRTQELRSQQQLPLRLFLTQQ